jgi:hypothetical protein
MRAWNGHMAAWNGRAGNWTRFHHGHFVDRHGRVFFVGGPWWGGYGYYDYGCWQWVPTRWGPQRIWVCGSYYSVRFAVSACAFLTESNVRIGSLTDMIDMSAAGVLCLQRRTSVGAPGVRQAYSTGRTTGSG